ncbi:CLIP domain-containing serine protease B8-like [Lutzomyia longipalpis]|uniref:CLIP domain-containing serine protease n=1 Tax=Lutzomyia longipalpis TaxID=7200 RepID=A0A7G3AZ79_LUTLO|nr:CLIP domain-containing serine protease B8-like [Lutzomyia longipalpis]
MWDYFRARVKIWSIFLILFLQLSHTNSESILRGCDIPNQDERGVCRPTSDCKAYRELLNERPLKSDKINFLKQLQCNEENSVCCTNEEKYENPAIENDPSTKKERAHTVSFETRFGGDELPTLKECGNFLGNKIIGGEIAGIDDYPWTALLVYESSAGSKPQFGCGGGLISRNYVLTAAHCVTGPITETKGSLMRVRLGEYNTETAEDCIQEVDGLDCADPPVDIDVMKVIPHPDYSSDTRHKYHDIALIQLAKATNYTDFIQPICLPMNDLATGIMNGNSLTVAGWGRTDMFRETRGFQPSPVKLFVKLPIIDISACSRAYRPSRLVLGPGQVCAGGKKSEDTCPGDSGSPLMYFSRKDGKWVCSGVVSLGLDECGTDGIPGVYTRVDTYMPWILSTIGAD